MIAAVILAGAALASAFAPLSGTASWYRYHEGQAAAGPALRQMLGPDWRGMTVQVCAATCISVVLTDWCQCYRGTGRERLIDLDRRDFAALAAPSRGLVQVTVR